MGSCPLHQPWWVCQFFGLWVTCLDFLHSSVCTLPKKCSKLKGDGWHCDRQGGPCRGGRGGAWPLDQVVSDVIEDKMNVAVVNKVTRVYSWVYTFLCVGQPQTFRRLDFLFFHVFFLLLIGRPCLLYVRALSEGTWFWHRWTRMKTLWPLRNHILPQKYKLLGPSFGGWGGELWGGRG